MKIYDYFTELERPIASILNDMSNRGLCIDLPYLNELKVALESQERPLKTSILNELGNINLNSPVQLLEAFNNKGINPEYKGKASTDQRGTLNTVYKNDPIVKLFKEWNEINTLLKKFVYSYLDRKVATVHCFFNQTGTRTGRLSCSNPNLLQIPRRTENGKLVRRMFVPRDGMQFGDCDFGQIEPRVLAHLSKDPVLCEMFNNGVDFHEFTAERLGIDRDKAKVLNLSVGYRATFESVMSQLRCDKDEAQKQIDQWWTLFPQLRRWQDQLIYESKRSGFCTTLLGHRIRIDGLSEARSWSRESAERQLINNITQGSAAEIMKKAMILIADSPYLSKSFGILVQVYDELLCESGDATNDMDEVRRLMEECCPELEVPLVVDGKIGKNWSECH